MRPTAVALAEQVRGQLTQAAAGLPAATTSVDAGLARVAVAALIADEDRVHGGLGRAPKFPPSSTMLALLRHDELVGSPAAVDVVVRAAEAMARGGIYDQLAGGFARYAVDEAWVVPHFEKMLYDNAQLVSLYSQAYQALGNPLYKAAVERTLAFIEREMTSPEGAFFSALDADSEGEEGLFYVWQKDELERVLGTEYDLAAAYYNVGGAGLWEHGRNILLRRMPDKDFAAEFGISEPELEERTAAINARLLAARKDRTPPGLDDKSLTSWNALMISGYCDAYEVFGRNEWKERAIASMELLLAKCKRDNGGLWHLYKGGKASINGYLEDYSFTTEALLDLYGTTFEERWLNEAHSLAEHAIRHFHDAGNGMFHFTSDLDPALIARPIELNDNVVPASNSSMAKALFRLGQLFDDQRYLDLSDRMLRTMVPRMAGYPAGHSNWAELMLAHVFPYAEIAITGPEALALRAQFAPHYLPNRQFLGSTTTSELPLLKGKTLPGSTIFVCENKTCRLPVPTVKEALLELR